MIIVRNFATAHFLSGFFLFLAGWGWGLSPVVVFGIPLVVYALALAGSLPALRQVSLVAGLERLKEVPKFYLFVILLSVFLNILFCLLPPAENLELDALNYHLAIPWQYYLRGRVVPLEWSVADKYPLYLQMAGLPLMTVTFPWVVKIANLFAFPGLLVVIWHWLSLFLLPERQRFWVLTLFCVLALYVKQYGTAMFDLVNAFYVLLGFYYLVRSVQSVKTPDLLWGSLLLGMVAALKTFFIYNVLVWMAGFFFWRFFLFREWPDKRDWIKIGLPFAAALLFLSPVWMRNVWMTGNPFFPLFLNLFGTVVENEGVHVVARNVWEQHGYGRSLLDFILAPFRLVFPIHNKFGYWTDPVLLGFLCGAVFSFKKQRKKIFGLVGLLVVLLFVAFFFMSQEARYLYSFWILIVVLGSPWVFERFNLKLLNWILVGQLLLGVSSFFLFHRQAILWIFRGALPNYLSTASYSFLWNREVENKNIRQLCLRNITGNYVSDILYFTVPVKLVQHFNTTMSLENPAAAKGCDAFMVGNQEYDGDRNALKNKGRLVSEEEFLLKIPIPSKTP
ncbi:MAG: hypothetical protein Q8P84_06615 [Deltaproteobacteria bacterium]|nr:hypothetical protein [Deltaproteobacteria bacterium]